MYILPQRPDSSSWAQVHPARGAGGDLHGAAGALARLPRLAAALRHHAGRRAAGGIFASFAFWQNFAEFLAKFRQNDACFRLYRHRFLQLNTRFAAFLKIYQIF